MRKLLIVLVVLGCLAVVADRIAEQVTEGRVAVMVKEREGLPSAPDVEFAGFPFLTQVLGNNLQQVTLTLPTVDTETGDQQQIRVDDVEARFFDVRTSMSLRRATADRLTGSAVIPYDSVSALGPFTASYAGTNPNGDGIITLTPDEGVPDGALDLSVDVGVSVTDGMLSYIGADGTTRVASVPRNLRPLLGTLLDMDHPLVGLPSSFTVASLEVEKSGISLTLAGRNVSLAR